METQNNQGMKVALVICILLVVALGGYIVYDKFITPENETERQEPVEESTEEKTNQNNETKKLIDDPKYFKTESMQRDINNKIVYIDLGFYKYNDDTIKYDIIINNKLYQNDTKETINTIILDPDQMTELNQYINNVVKLIKNNFGILESDKDYLYFKTYEVMPAGDEGIHIFILNENGDILTVERLKVAGQSIFNPKSKCQSSLYQVGDEIEYKGYNIGKDTIYILQENDGTNPDGDVDEYKITISNDKATKIKTATCQAEIAGSSTRS